MLSIIIAIIVKVLAGMLFAYLLISRGYTILKECDERDRNMKVNSICKEQK